MKNKIIIALLSTTLLFAAAGCGSDETAEPSEDLTTGEALTEDGESVVTEPTEAEAGSEVVSESETSSEAEPVTEISSEESSEAAEGTETEEIPAIEDITVESEDDGVLLLKAYFGTEDDETGNAYVFIYLNTVTIDDTEYYAYTWSWSVDDHYSRLTDVFVSLDGSAIYQGDYDADGCTFNSDNMLQ